MSKKFIRKKEDFVCENCKKEVKGNGYTNHCPFCLFSKHVDVNPGDRLSDCKGMMEPISSEVKKGENYIIFQCILCGHIKKNKLAENDDFEKFLEISKKQVDKFYKKDE